MPVRIAVLGSTGSIGTQALSVARLHKDRIRVVALAANSNIELVSKQIEEFRPQYVGIGSEEAAQELASRHKEVRIIPKVGLSLIPALPEVDIIVNGVSGFNGLFPLLAALKAGKTVALANKESIVCAHGIVDKYLSEYGGRIIPVDSEQSALFQCLAAGRREDVKRLILTASGGMFRNFTKEQLSAVTPDMALRHPTWNMGRKITVDSSSLFNKGLEIMEAGWLFGFGPDEVSVFIHPQSIVHSMVEFVDGSVVAQLAKPDMRLAIQYAITYPERIPSSIEGAGPAAFSGLEFFEPDTDRFPAIRLAYEAFREGKCLPIAYNAANEVAVERFLKGDITFTDIASVVENTMEHMPRGRVDTVEGIIFLDEEARRLAREWKA